MGAHLLRNRAKALTAIVCLSLAILLLGCATASAPAVTHVPGSTEAADGGMATNPARPTSAPATPTTAASPTTGAEQPTDAPAPTVSNSMVARSEKARDEMPVVAWDALPRLTGKNNYFAFDFYRRLAENDDGNLFFSPYSLSAALAMTYAGAAGDTAEQMAGALRFDLPQDELHPAFNALDLELAAISAGESDDGEALPELNIANALWAQQGYEFKPPFLDTLAQQYGAGLEQLDFTQPEGRGAAAGRINQWASEQTAGKIPSVVNADSFGPCLPPTWECTRLVITNAIYFKGLWKEKHDFARSDTSKRVFHLADGGMEFVPMMQQERELEYHETEDYQAVELPYQGDRLAMLVLLPKADRRDEFDAGLDAGVVAYFDKAALNDRIVRLSMPRFKLEKQVNAKSLLRDMGMTDAFSPDHGVADFSGMADFSHPDSPDVGIYIESVFQKAFVEVNEKGTEAAAVTAVIGGAVPQSVPPTPLPPIVMEVNRPFIFVIRDTDTGSILFVGRIADPSLEN